MKLLKTRPIFLGLTASVVLGIATSQPVKAASFITFENIPGTTPYEGLAINNQFLGSHGITFSLVGGGSPVLAEVGGNRSAFTRNNGAKDKPKGTSLNGRFFITDDYGGKTKPKSLLVEYDKPVSIASGQILDIDRNGKEEWTVVAFDSFGRQLQPLKFSTKLGGLTGDGVATPWSFSNHNTGISSVLLNFTGSARDNIGVGFDNFSFTPLQTTPTLQSFLLNPPNGDINIFEGQSLSATLSASDIDRDNLNFYVNDKKLSTKTPSGSSGSASTTVQIGPFPDDGSYTQTAQVKDSDGVTSQTITRTVNVQNVAPTLDLNLSNAVINEGESALVELSATDPGADAISFFLNNEHIGTDTRTSGNRFVKKNLGVFADEGTFTYTGKAEDDDGGISNILTKTLTVKNLDPTITSLTEDFTIRTNTKFDLAATATDPGINDILTFDWDLDGDGLFDDLTGSSGQWSFSRPGLYALNLRVSDGDGGFAYGSVDVEAVPEPGSVLALLALGALGVPSLLKRKSQ